MVKKATIEELITIKTRTENVAFAGEDSFKRLKCLNRLAHFAIHGSIFELQKIDGNPFGPNPVLFLDHFVVNESFLHSIENEDVEQKESGFRKVQKRLIEDLKFFIEKAKSALSPAQGEGQNTRRPHPQLLLASFNAGGQVQYK